MRPSCAVNPFTELASRITRAYMSGSEELEIYYEDSQGVSIESLSELLVKHGYKVVEFRSLDPGVFYVKAVKER
ncbi:MAG: hypothetical protein QXE24_03035 [Desulfurococcaceae archaeon]